jgi:hypothetical protein
LPLRVLDNARQVAVSVNETCALLRTGEMYCWGQTLASGVPTLVPTLDVALANVTALSIQQGEHCALLTNGTVACWASGEAPTPITGVQDAVSVSALTVQSGCARLGTGRIRCWGSNFDGQLGDGTFVTPPLPGSVEVLGITGAVKLSGASALRCVLLSSGSVECWGAPNTLPGRYGLGDANVLASSPVPVPVVGIANAIDLAVPAGNGDGSAAQWSACALLDDGGVVCWGTEHAATLIERVEGARGIAGGGGYYCVTLANGLVRCGGANDKAQLGIGTTSPTGSGQVLGP